MEPKSEITVFVREHLTAFLSGPQDLEVLRAQAEGLHVITVHHGSNKPVRVIALNEADAWEQYCKQAGLS